MSLTPTIYLTNWSSTKQHGPGRKLCAMAFPRKWEKGEGFVVHGRPDGFHLKAWKRYEMEFKIYKGLTISALERSERLFRPGHLTWTAHELDKHGLVEDGDTLLCSCARPDSPRRKHECHLEWLAPYLVEAGWRVILYGEEYSRAPKQADILSSLQLRKDQ